MGTISSAFGIISGALDADQSALSIVANNVANANTTGYTREVANFQENDPVTINGTAYGDGVTQTGPTSMRDKVLTARLDQQQQQASATSSRLAALQTVQALFTVDSGTTTSTSGDIGSDITNFFSSLTSLEANPTSDPLRQAVLSKATLLSGDVSNAANSLNAQRASLDENVSSVAAQVNALTSSIAQLNTQIQQISTGSDALTLEDQRQQDISDLSKLVGINQIQGDDSNISITTTSGVLLVSDNKSYQITTGKVDGMTHFFVGETDVTSGLTTGGGSLGGYLTVRDQDIPDAQTKLNQLAYSVSTKINALNNAGSDYYGATGTTSGSLNIFSEPTSLDGAAANMSVVMTDPYSIAAASAGAGTGDDANAISMADVQNQTIVDGETPSNFYSSFVSSLGTTVSEVNTDNTALQASVTQLQTQNDSLSAVNLNDEASSMTTLERSYQAASQVFTMLDRLIADTINLGQSTTVS